MTGDILYVNLHLLKLQFLCFKRHGIVFTMIYKPQNGVLLSIRYEYIKVLSLGFFIRL